MHTPRDATRGRQNGVDRGCVETPEKPRFPKSRQMDARDTFSHEKIWKIPALNLNADANEFIPGSFASLLPAILPSVPTNPCIPSPVPPGLEMCGLNGMGPAWDDMTTQFGMESGWEQSTLSTHLSSFPTSEASPKDLVDDGEESQSENRMLKLASCLLRFLMQAPVLETSDLMKIIETQLGEAEDSGPWCQRDLKTVSFTYKDLALLDARLAALLHKLSPELLARLPRQLNLDWDPTGMSWSFKEPPELRRLIAKNNKNPTLGQFSITFLSHASGCVPMHLDRMLKFKRAGIACLQGLDSSTPDLACGIIGKGYGKCCGKGPSGANTIMWDRSYWAFCASHECDAGLAVDLISADQAIRIACWRPRLEHSFDGSSEAFGHFLLSENVNLVVCADLSLIGGTSSAGLVPALLGLQSAMFEILGHEVLTPKPVLGDSDDFHALWDPCGIFFRGVEPTTALSGYTEGYLSKMFEGSSDLSSNFPDGKPVLFAEFGAGLSRDPDLKKWICWDGRVGIQR